MSKINTKLYFYTLFILGAIIIKNEFLKIVILFGTLLGIFFTLHKNMATIANLSEKNIKVKNLKYANIVTLIFVLNILGVSFLFRNATPQNTNKMLLIIITLFMMYFGNIAPRIPFNKYFGLRLPWILKDENTWRYAHRVVGYVSFPGCIFMFFVGYFINFNIGIILGMVIIVVFPAIFSYIFYKNQNKMVS